MNFNWLWRKAGQGCAEREITGDIDAAVREHVIVSFLNRYNVRMQARQRSKKVAKQNFEPDLKKWYATTQEKLVRSGRNDDFDENWGRYRLMQSLNVDQSPIPFVVGTTKTYDHTEKGVV